MESSLCLELPREPLLAALAGESGLLADLLPVLTRRVAECGNCVVEGTFFRVEPRIARLFVKLAESVGREEDGGIFVPVPLSRQDLADMAGTTLETSIRILSRWGKEGLVETRPDGFLIHRPEGLEALGEG
jgi:CRP-like cAMP-binding protein